MTDALTEACKQKARDLFAKRQLEAERAAIPSGWRRTFDRIFRSRAYLERTYCAHGAHWFRWWIYGDVAPISRHSGQPIPATRTWYTLCAVCRSSMRYDAETEPPKGVRRWRRYKS